MKGTDMTDEQPTRAWIVRPARLADLPATAKLAAELVRLHHGYDPLRFMCVEPLEAGYLRFLRTQVDRVDAALLVAASTKGDEEMIVGYVLGGLEDRNWSDLRDACGKIHDLFVAESARGHGVATRLVEAAIAHLEALGAPRVVLMTAWQNEPARRLFERLGFRRTMLEMTREAKVGNFPRLHP
jgi:ribosomal protein S18 acetylase RimI-like enzyme